MIEESVPGGVAGRVARLRELLEPTSAVIIGATDRSTWSRMSFANLSASALPGGVYLVNRRGEECHGQRTYTGVAELPSVPDLAIVLTGPNSLEGILRECRAKGIRNLIVLAAGLSEAGPEGAALQHRLVDSARAADQLILGPNNLGFINSSKGIVAFSHDTPVPPYRGGVSIASQSGALILSMLPYMLGRGVGTSLTITVGNEAMVTATDAIEYMVADENTRVIGAYMEQITDPGRFIRAAESARQAGKPLVILKAGRGELSARVAAAHTGALAGDDKIFDAACRQLGVIRVDSFEDLVATTGVLDAYGGLPGRRAGVVLASGAHCAAVAELAERSGIDLPQPDPRTIDALRGDGLPDFVTINNPLDVTGYYVIDPYIQNKGIQRFAEDPNFDFIITQGIVPGDEPTAGALGRIQEDLANLLKGLGKPVVPMGFLPGEFNAFARDWMAAHGYPHVPDSYERGVPAVGRSAHWQRRRAEIEPLGGRIREALELPADHRTWGELEAGRFLESHGIPYVPTRLVSSSTEAAEAAAQVGFPVALKIVSPDMQHKSDVGGVVLNVRCAQDAAAAYDRIVDRVGAAAPGARLSGVSVAPMRTEGVEILIGVVRHEGWGPVLAVGLGGIYVEVLRDTALLLLPASRSEIGNAIRSLRGARLLSGVRGAPAADFDTLTDVIKRFCDVALGLGDRITAMEINPLLVHGGRIEALDALIVWNKSVVPGT